VVNLYCYNDSPCGSDIARRDPTIFLSWITSWSLVIVPSSCSTTQHWADSKMDDTHDLANYKPASSHLPSTPDSRSQRPSPTTQCPVPIHREEPHHTEYRCLLHTTSADTAPVLIAHGGLRVRHIIGDRSCRELRRAVGHSVLCGNSGKWNPGCFGLVGWSDRALRQ
jgi:hypothetical protein